MRQQQLIISGLGGQGVLFITRLLAEAAIRKGYPVFTAETHGMAQRGGTVISHLKVGSFTSPMIRPGQADGLLSLKEETLGQHGFYLKKTGWAVVNCRRHPQMRIAGPLFCADADAVACRLRIPRSVNLVLLGFALAWEEKALFCDLADIETVLTEKLAEKKDLLEVSLQALARGYADGVYSI